MIKYIVFPEEYQYVKRVKINGILYINVGYTGGSDTLTIPLSKYLLTS